ncbi:MAG TPA: ATP-binding protein, partial [Rhodothermales bacterium]|nr:ATP-binding protein [Rhodothermales bacterium]
SVQQAFVDLTRLDLTPERAAALVRLAEHATAQAPRTAEVDAMVRADREYAVETWLEDQDIEDAWELAPALVRLGYDEHTLATLEDDLGHDAGAVAVWLARAEPVYTLARDIAEATGRISEIVKALKTYSYLGQAPVRPVDVTEGLESTLVILRNKLKAGITVHREYAPGLPQIEAFGSELNQVWTNLIDNASDAMDGRGTLTIRARRDGDHVAVEIEDDGPGIPAPVQKSVFDPFFTTKAPGKGTGLGLSTSHNIVVKKHGGTIDVASRPGNTRFTVRLPIRLAAQAKS